MRELRLAAARERQHGVQIMSFEQLAARLAGGLSRPVDDEVLRATIQSNLPSIALGELNNLKALPGPQKPSNAATCPRIPRRP